MYLAKGIMATAAIEGNTLSEKEVEARIEGTLSLPPSKEYLGTEIDNILNASNLVLQEVVVDGHSGLTVKALCDYNRMVLNGLSVEKDVIPGCIREHNVTVGRYRGAPAEDCEYLLNQMCEWLDSDVFQAPKGYEIVYGVLKAIIAHIYIAWIHPFGDGNGRTARLAEVRILLEAGAPSAAAHLLSNFYNQTRAEYYRQLDAASRSGGDILPFIKYAAQGLCEELREQIDVIRSEQFDVTWINYVHDMFTDRTSPSDIRRRHLVLEISKSDRPVPINSIRRLSPSLAELYADKTNKTISRDLNALDDMNLIQFRRSGVRARVEQIAAFLPVRKVSSEDDVAPPLARQTREKIRASASQEL
jgi:Fic family protein